MSKCSGIQEHNQQHDPDGNLRQEPTEQPSLHGIFLGMNFSQQQTSSLFVPATRTRKNEKHHG